MLPVLWLLGFPSPVIEFFILGVTIFLVGALTLAAKIEDVKGIEGTSLRQRRREREPEPTLMED
ncbi:hypothetical protein [Haladaptatus salinisoli]|uniref:hypothetical protein n=1 Tax=Haladaptatus salinisoli TaxID=2884876 RepID=UPI001D0B87A5|nr:hypothetical protein [Haladaptatus salinisoli]